MTRRLAVGAILCAVASWTFASSPPPTFDTLLQDGEEHRLAGRHAEAREGYESALAVADITSEQAAQAWLKVAASHMAAYKWQPANAALENVLAQQGILPATRAQAYLGIARIFSNYGGEWGWGKVKAACDSVLALPDLAEEYRQAARKSLVNALMGLKEYPAARRAMADFAADDTVPAADRVAMRILSAKTAMLLPDFEAARTDLAAAGTLDALSDADRADLQLQLALSYVNAGDYERAAPELIQVLDMPGAGARRTTPGRDNASTPAHEARLRLHLRRMLPETGASPTLAVLFIGSSMTMRGDMPHLLATLAASAPAGRPRILPAVFARGGTRIDVFWNDGDTPGTARHFIATEPWDAICIEMFYTLKPDELETYGRNFVDLARASGAKPILYTSPAAQGQPYPDAHRAYQSAITNLAQALSVPVAPAVDAYLRFLGPQPGPERLGILYNDWIHATEKGNYLIACCIYAALTGYSPVGLAPAGLSEAEARAFQEAAWEAYQETRTALSIDGGPDNEQ